MKKVVLGALAIGAIAAVAIVVSPRASAQQRDRDGSRFNSAQFLMLEGPGSSIGVSVRDQAPADAAGVLIESVQEGTPATKAGVQKGDVVIEFDGERTRSARQFTRLVRETPPGRTVRMTVLREGAKRTLDITPESRDAVTMQRFPDVTLDVDRALRNLPRDFNFRVDPFLGETLFGSSRRLGLRVSPVSDQLATYFGVKEGVLISEVLPNTPASSAGLKAGDVIMAVNGRAVSSPADLTREVSDAQQGSSIELRVMRDRKETSVKVTVPERRTPTARSLPI